MPPEMRWADCTTSWRGGAVAIPGGHTARQDALNCAYVKVCEGFRCQPKFLQPLVVEEVLLHLFHHTICVDHFSLSVMCMPRNLKHSTFSAVVPSMWIRGCCLCCFLTSTISSFVLLMLSENVFSWHHPYLLPVGCLIVVGNQAFYCCVVCKIDD